MTRSEPSEIQSPAEREGVVAALACLVCFIYLLAMAAPAVEWLHLRGAGYFVYIFIPFALTFTLLYGSHIHREMAKVNRAAFLLLASFFIFAGTALFIGAVVFFASVFVGIGRVGPG
jgi:predicted permease